MLTGTQNTKIKNVLFEMIITKKMATKFKEFNFQTHFFVSM